MFTRLSRIIKLGVNNFLRNWSLSIAAVVMTSLTLTTVTIFVILHFSATSATQMIKEKIDIMVYFYDETAEKEIQDIQLKLSSRFDLDSVKYISKEGAVAKWQSRPIPQNIKNLVTSEENPLFRSLQIKTQNQKTLDDVVNLLDNQTYQDKIYKVSYKENSDVIDKILMLDPEGNIYVSFKNVPILICGDYIVYNYNGHAIQIPKILQIAQKSLRENDCLERFLKRVQIVANKKSQWIKDIFPNVKYFMMESQ